MELSDLRQRGDAVQAYVRDMRKGCSAQSVCALSRALFDKSGKVAGAYAGFVKEVIDGLQIWPDIRRQILYRL